MGVGLGQALANDREWFAPPPPEIGKVVAAWSTQRAGSTIWPVSLKMFIVLLGGALGGCVAWVWAGYAHANNRREREALFTLLLCILVPIAMILVAALMKWRHRLWYVGADGVARLTHRGNPETAKPAHPSQPPRAATDTGADAPRG